MRCVSLRMCRSVSAGRDMPEKNAALLIESQTSSFKCEQTTVEVASDAPVCARDCMPLPCNLTELTPAHATIARRIKSALPAAHVSDRNLGLGCAISALRIGSMLLDPQQSSLRDGQHPSSNAAANADAGRSQQPSRGCLSKWLASREVRAGKRFSMGTNAALPLCNRNETDIVSRRGAAKRTNALDDHEIDRTLGNCHSMPSSQHSCIGCALNSRCCRFCI